MLERNSDARFRNTYVTPSLHDALIRYAGIGQSPSHLHYLKTILDRCPRGGTALETGIGSGDDSIFLSKRGVIAYGIDRVPEIVERANIVNNMLEGKATFRVADMFDAFGPEAPCFDVIHHQGVLEHFHIRRALMLLALMVLKATYVIFSIPSVHYPFEPEFGDELLWPLDEIRKHLAHFDIELLEYYGDPQHGGNEHILCVLRGQEMTSELQEIIAAADAPLKPGVTALILAHNEEVKLPDCLKSVQFCDRIVVVIMGSTDRTREICLEHGVTIVEHENKPVYDSARNIGAEEIDTEFTLVVDADERIPPALAEDLLSIVQNPESNFAGMMIPFQHKFGGRWLKMLWPGYTAPRLLRTGKFHFNTRLHGGVHLDGPSAYYPATDPAKAIEHLNFDNIQHHHAKIGRYTDGEALTMFREGREFSVVEMFRHAVQDFISYMDNTPATDDGPWKLFYALNSADYRLVQHAKLFELRANAGILKPHEWAVPKSTAETANLLLSLLTPTQALPQPAAIAVSDAEDAVEIVSTAPHLHPSGIGEDCRNLLLAAAEAGVNIGARAIWSEDISLLTTDDSAVYAKMRNRPAKRGYIHLIQDLNNWPIHPDAGATIARHMFETDRLPQGVPEKLNLLDLVIVPSEHNVRTFADSGVSVKKLVVVPGCFDPAPYLEQRERREQRELGERERFTFLTCHEWSLRKGYDCTLIAFLKAFEGRDDVQLIVKTWAASVVNTADQIRDQAAALVRDRLGIDLLADDRVRFVTEQLPRPDLLNLYKACDAFVLASRGEGFGRPLMEAMACCKPCIGTGATGNLAFMNADNSYLIESKWVAVPPQGYAEIPTYKGHRWCEPNIDHLVELLRHVESNREEAAARAKRGQDEICAKFNRKVVGEQLAAVLRGLGGAVGLRGDSRTLRLASSLSARQAREHDAEARRDAIDGVDAPQAAEGHVLGKRAKRRAENAAKSAKASPVVALTPGPSPASGRGENTRTASQRQSVPIPKTQHRIPTRIRVRWEGAIFSWHSLGYANREILRRLAADPDIELSIIPVEQADFGLVVDPELAILMPLIYAPLSGPADFHIRHFYPPRFQVPAEGKLILIQPWEYYRLPTMWIEPILKNVHEVWCYSKPVYDCYLESGIAAEKLRVVPLGVDTNLFRPDGPPYVFTDEPGAGRLATMDGEPWIALFVGGTIPRKGIARLIEAFTKSFSAYDNAVLVIKDTGTETVYRGGTQGDMLRAIAADASRALLIYIDRNMSPAALAMLYRSAHLVTLPYSNEGYCLPACEAQASGVAPAVPEGGPTSDFCTDKTAVIIPAKLVSSGDTRVGDIECCGPTSFLEIDPRELGRKMRWAYEHRDEVAAIGRAAALHARAHHTWDVTVGVIKERLVELSQEGTGKREEGRETAASGRVDGPSSADCVGKEDASAQETKKEGSKEKADARRDVKDTPPHPSVPSGQALTSPAPGRGTDVPSTQNPIPGAPVLRLVSGAEVRDKRSASQMHDAGQKHPSANERALTPTSPQPSPDPSFLGRRGGNAPPSEHRKPNTEHRFAVLRAEPTIALTMIMRDEEAVLPACLASVKPFYDAIYIVDTGSTDNSIEIARSFGCIVSQRPWDFSFSNARNHALDQTRGEDYIGWVDCDDTMPAPCGEAMRRMVAMAEDRVTAYLMQVHIPPAPGTDGYTIVDHLKLWRNNPLHRWEGRIHEQMLESIYAAGGIVERTNLYVVHSGYDDTAPGQKKKHDRDEYLLGLDESERPLHPFPKWNWGMSRFHWGEFAKAIVKLEESLALSKPHESTVRKAYALLGASHLALGNKDAARHNIDTGLKLTPRDPELLFRAANLYGELGDFAAAEQFYLRLFNNRDTTQIDSLDISTCTYKANLNYGLLLRHLNRLAEAESQWRTALLHNPNFVPAWHALGELYTHQRRFDDAADIARHLETLSPPSAEALRKTIAAARGTRVV